MPDFSPIDASGISEVANTLATKISNAFGRHFDPRQKIRMAEAEAAADRILRVGAAETDLAIAQLNERAAYRFANEEMTKQINIENIIGKALPGVDDNANPDAMEDDWIMNFFDKCRTVSDDDMQQIWAGILAGEANNPGSFSRRTVNLVADLDKRAAESFRNLCGFAWRIGSDIHPLVFDTGHDIYNRNEVDFRSIHNLEAMGLIRYDGALGFKLTNLPMSLQIYYYEHTMQLTMPEESGNDLNVGEVMLTQAGIELAPICGAKPVEGFFEYAYDHWAGEGLVSRRGPAYEKVEPPDAETEAKIQSMLEFSELASQMRREVGRLTEQYPYQWVAMVPGGELFMAGAMDELLAVLDEKGLRDGNVVIEFLDPSPTPLIL